MEAFDQVIILKSFPHFFSFSGAFCFLQNWTPPPWKEVPIFGPLAVAASLF